MIGKNIILLFVDLIFSIFTMAFKETKQNKTMILKMIKLENIWIMPLNWQRSMVFMKPRHIIWVSQ